MSVTNFTARLHGRKKGWYNDATRKTMSKMCNRVSQRSNDVRWPQNVPRNETFRSAAMAGIEGVLGRCKFRNTPHGIGLRHSHALPRLSRKCEGNGAGKYRTPSWSLRRVFTLV